VSDDATVGIANSEPDTVQPLSFTLTLDLNDLKGIALTGVTRAAAFLAVGLNATNHNEPLSLVLTNDSMFRFFPEPAPEEMVKQTVSEFRDWVIGNALREIDTHFSRFLDAVWGSVEWSKLSGSSVRSDHVIKGIDSDTNCANKYARVFESIGAPFGDSARLKTLSNARNCITHAAGIVTPRHTNEGDVLAIRWQGLETRLVQGDFSVVIDGPIDVQGIQTPDHEQGSEIVVSFVDKVRIFGLGERLMLSPAELHDICFYFTRVTDFVLIAFSEFLVAKGLISPSGSGMD
jgi:hypothetical protein